MERARRRCRCRGRRIPSRGALVPFLAVWLTGALGWQGALRALGALIIIVALPLTLFVKESPAPDALAAPAALAAPQFGLVLRAPAFYLLLAGSMCSIAAVGGTNQHLKLLLSLDHGYSQGAAAQITSLVLASSLIGRLGMGWLADRLPKKYVMLLIYGLVASAIPLLFLVGKPGAIYLFADQEQERDRRRDQHIDQQHHELLREPVRQPTHPQSADQARREHQRCDACGPGLREAVIETQEELQVLVGAAYRGDRAHAAREQEIKGRCAEYRGNRGGNGGRDGTGGSFWRLPYEQRQR